MLHYRHRAIVLLAAMVLLTGSAFARNSSDRVQFAKDIRVQPGEKVGDLVCIACSIYVRGEAAGDAVAIGGSIVLDSAQIDGDAVAILGGLRLNGSSQVGGDSVAILGSVYHDSEAHTGGAVTSIGGPLWFLLIVFLPLALFAAFIALVVWLFQRARRPSTVAAYPGGVSNTRA
jgi:hypothetical protein